MSKDAKGERSFPQRLKYYFKQQLTTTGGIKEIQLTEELCTELGGKSPVATRIRVFRELIDELATKKLEEKGIEKLWGLIKDLLSPPTAVENQCVIIQLLTNLAISSDKLGHMRLAFFLYISENYQNKELPLLFSFFRAIIKDGKQLEMVEETTGPLFLKWLPAILSSSEATNGLSLLDNLVRFNSPYLDELVIAGCVRHVVSQLIQSSNESMALQCLRVLESILAYSHLPSVALPTFITALTRAINVPSLTKEVWKIMRNLLGTHLGNSGIYVLCQIIQRRGDPHMVRGAIFFLTSALWGNSRVVTLNYKPATILPTLQQAGEMSDVLVLYELAISIQKVVSRMSLELHYSSWDLLLDIVNSLMKSTVLLTEEKERGAVLAILLDVIDTIEQLIELQQFGGSTDKFLDIIDAYSHLRSEVSVSRLLEHKSIYLDSIRPYWLDNLGTLLRRYFREESRPTVRLKMLEVFKKVYDINRCYYGRELINAVVLTHFDGIENDTDVDIRKATSSVLVHMVAMENSNVVEELLVLLDKLILAPYRREVVADIINEHEACDVLEAVSGLVAVFKRKLFELPSEHAIHIYCLLLSCLEHHYRHPTVLGKVPQIRQQVLELILDMRANSKYELGFSSSIHQEETSSSSLLPKYSPYIVVDHKHGQKITDDPNFPLLSATPDSRVTAEGITKGEETIPDQLELPRGVLEGGVSGHSSPQLAEKTDIDVTYLSLTQAAMMIIVAMKHEKDWPVLRTLLERVPEVLQNKAIILSRETNNIDYFAAALCDMVTADNGKSAELLPESLCNKPSKFSRSDFHAFVFPVLATLASYSTHLNPRIQRQVIECLMAGVLSRCAVPLCVGALTLCVLEMRETMVKLLRGVMNNLSRVTASVPNALPILEFLSTLLHLPKVYANFVAEQYMVIFAIAIPYTNPIKFHHFTVSLAYHVIAMWFLKCRLNFRKNFVHFIAKNLHMTITNEDIFSVQRKRSASVHEQAILQARARVKRSQSFSHKRLEEMVPKIAPGKEPVLAPNREKVETDMIQFHKDLRETCVDLMARYSFSQRAPMPKRSAIAQMLVAGGQSQSWILGNKIITITTSGCSQRPLRRGLCDKCLQQCGMEKEEMSPCENEDSQEVSGSRRRHRSEFYRSVSNEAKYQPQSKDDLHMRFLKRKDSEFASVLASGDTLGKIENVTGQSEVAGQGKSTPLGIGQVGSASASSSEVDLSGETNKRSQSHLCACWCQGWAEIYIRQSTGNTSWMMRVQNEQNIVPGEELPLHDLCDLYGSTSGRRSKLKMRSPFPLIVDDSDATEDEKNEDLCMTTVDNLKEESKDPSCEVSDNVFESEPRPAWSSLSNSQETLEPNCSESSSNLKLYDGSEPDDNDTLPTDDDEALERYRNAVMRRYSSPEIPKTIVGILKDAGDGVFTSSLNVESKSAQQRQEVKSCQGAPPVMAGSSFKERITPESSPPIVARARHASCFQPKTHIEESSLNRSPNTSESQEDLDDGSPRPLRRGRGHTISVMNPASRKIQFKLAPSNSAPVTIPTNCCIPNVKEGKGGVSPSFVFLQLYYSGCLEVGTDRPLLVQTQQPEVQRALRVLDLIKPQETHKIGVLYIRQGQTNEQQILRNSFGCMRYMRFLEGLGSAVDLESVTQEDVFLGGLDNKGDDGKLVYIWHDDIMQVVFHVATLMPTKESDPNCNGKKRHIGNNYVTIVYNESGHPYNINTIKGQFNHTVVEIVPADHETNSVGILCRPELKDFVGGEGVVRLISDTNLPILVRQMALHLDLASTIMVQGTQNPYASNWMERLRKVRKLKQLVQELESQSESYETNEPKNLDFTDLIELDRIERGEKSKASNK